MILSYAEAARRLGVMRAAIQDAVRRGRLRATPASKTVPGVTLADLLAYQRSTAGWHRGQRNGRPRTGEKRA